MTPAQYISQQVPLADYLEQHLDYKIHRLPQQISCPLHADRKPSMRLYAPKEKDGFCFSCGKSYTSFQMHQQLYSLSYKDTMQQLSEMFSLDMSRYDKAEKTEFYLSDKKVAPLVSRCVQHIKRNPSKLPKNFDKLADKIYKAIKYREPQRLYLKQKESQ